MLTPPNGWIFNVNNWPYTAAGPNSPKKADYPRYMDSAGENPRGAHAIRVLSARKDFTLPTLIAAAYDPYLTAFAELVPGLLAAYDAAAGGRQGQACRAHRALRAWDYRWSAQSVPTSVAVFWGEALWAKAAPDAKRAGTTVYAAMAKAPPAQKLAALAEATDRLTKDFGAGARPGARSTATSATTPPSSRNSMTGSPASRCPFASAQWGSLASFGARRYEGTKRYYGTSGNSFVAVVEFGDKVRARAVTAGGESGDPASGHFSDQAQRYAAGDLREVYFYPDQLKGHTERTYRPGE